MMFCCVWLLVSLVQLSPALPVSQKHVLSCSESTAPEDERLKSAQQPETAVEMATGDLVPAHYPARRAAQVALHYINLHHGSPFKVFGLQQVHQARAEDVAAGGRKYELDFSVTEWASGGSAVFRCTAQVFFPASAQHGSPEVQCVCEGLRQINSSSEEAAFYHRYRDPECAVNAHNIPDSYGNMTEDMKPFWHLARVAASFIMLRESSENTEYNMAQLANVTQLETQENQLMLKYHVLLHDMVSQEIIHWKLLCSWSPDGGVRVLETEWQPKCPHAAPPNSTDPAPLSTAN